MRFNNEIKAGIVVAAAIAAGMLFFLKTGTNYTETYEVKTYFQYAGNLTADATVKLAGIEVGRLKEMKFVYTPETKVECILEIDGVARIREDSLAYIDTAGFVGDAYIGITAGESSEFLKAGTTLNSEDPVQMRLLMKKADDITKNLDSILVDIKSIVSDNKGNIDDIVVNLEATTENFKEFSEDVKKHPWKLMFKGE